MRVFVIWIGLFLGVFSCVPREQVVLRSIDNVELTPGDGIDPVLKADALFYNPNRLRMRLREIKIDVFVDGKKSARVDQKLKSLIKSKSEFSVPLEVKLSLKEIGLMDALRGIFGGKTYELHYLGHIRVSVRGVPVKIPVDYKKQVKLRF